MNVVVVDLFGDVGRSGRTGVEVKSNKGESALMMATVGADELTLTEAHVRPEGERHGAAGHGVCSGPAPADVRQTHKPVEVCNLRRVADIGERCCGVQRVMVDKNAKRLKWRKAPRNRIDLVAPGAVPILIVVGMSRLWAYEAGSQHRACSSTNKIASAEPSSHRPRTQKECAHRRVLARGPENT